jgi:hypothetical protein
MYCKLHNPSITRQACQLFALGVHGYLPFYVVKAIAGRLSVLRIYQIISVGYLFSSRPISTDPCPVPVQRRDRAREAPC